MAANGLFACVCVCVCVCVWFCCGANICAICMACWMNWRPFLNYSLGVSLYGVISPGLVIGLLAVLFPPLQGIAPTLVVLLMGTVIAPTVFASFYVVYRDIFGLSELA